MNGSIPAISATEHYSAYLRYNHKAKLPKAYPLPQPPSIWPAENVALFERYLAWLIVDGAGYSCIMNYYIPVAGHMLGYHLRPHEQLNLDTDLDCAMDLLRAKQLGKPWLARGRSALTRFRRFMHEERGQIKQPVTLKQANTNRYHEGLPSWLVEQITQYQHIRQANWRYARLNDAIRRFWSSHTQLWRWLFAHYSIETISDIKRAYVFAYVDKRVAAGYSPRGVNSDMCNFLGTLRFLQEQGFAIPQELFRLQGIKETDSLPRFLSDEQMRKLQSDLEQRVQQPETKTGQRNALLDRAAFYLLWQGGLRLGEVEELRLDELNLAQKQLLIRQGKGSKDRAIYLTETAVSALEAYLDVRGSGSTNHVFLFRHKPVCKDFIRDRIKAAGERTGVKVTPHQLRHTYATQLLNAGCRITTIQTLLGHKHLNTTMTYARIHDRTVADDYYAAMAMVEKRLEPHLNAPQDPVRSNWQNVGKATNSVQQMVDLVDAVQAEWLSADQQASINELREKIVGLDRLPGNVASSSNQIVKVLPASPETMLSGLSL